MQHFFPQIEILYLTRGLSYREITLGPTNVGKVLEIHFLTSFLKQVSIEGSAHTAQINLSRKVCYAPINGLPQDGGAGQPTGNLTFSGFQMSISPPLGLHCKSNSHPWGPPEFHLI